nr:hypothetical protein [Desulfobacula sp.]
MKEKPGIRFIFFSAQEGQQYEKILGFAKRLFLPAQISIHSKPKSFSKAVLEPGFDHRIILILAASPGDLARILSLRNLLENRSVILILPDSEEDTMTQALSLYPRYIDYVQNDLKDVYPVLKKMVEKLYGQTDEEKKSR